ncbi:MAG TPA: hypothetical protein VMI55_03165 [Thermoplasmata archaeon]|nr:hypothetical protein [Thermoplasmata archaeon]
MRMRVNMYHAPPAPHGSHPCLSRRCGHAQEHHVHTPELAASTERVVWCTQCRRHEVRRARFAGWFLGRRPSVRPIAS